MDHKNYLNKSLKGFILPTALFFMLSSLGIVTIYFNWLGNKLNQLEYRIAVAKATYNAESGIAEKAYPYMSLASFEKDTTLTGRSLNFNFKSVNVKSASIKMGSYEEVQMGFDINTSERTGSAVGVATWGTDAKDTLYRVSRIRAMPNNFGIYMYFTDTEEAGGAPFSYGPPDYVIGQRRAVKFYNQDVIEGVIQSNDRLDLTSSGGVPNFNNATWFLPMGVVPPALSNGSVPYGPGNNALWSYGNEVDTSSHCILEFPPPGYEILKSQASIIYDSGRKIGGGSKDTLIMTEVEFYNDSRFRVTQWWYLMPPHLRENISSEARNNPYPHHLDGAQEYIADINNYDYELDRENDFDILAEFCDRPNNPLSEEVNINTCKPYLDSLRSYHSKRITSMNNPANESSIYYTGASAHGIAGQHFDFQPLDYNGNIDQTALLIDEMRTASSPTVIYIKDGPVKVHGTYKGKYSIVTDVFTAYRRHAWNDSLNGTIPLDTIWNNIWLIDDLVNADTFGDGDLEESQPNDACRGGSNNIMGLISGANIVVANTRGNGAGNGGNNINASHAFAHIRINAGMIALNESFVAHYWQNTTRGQNNGQPIPTNWGSNIVSNYNPPTTGYYNAAWTDETDATYRRYTNYPPWGDSKGRVKADSWTNANNLSNVDDKRGKIVLWGGVVQRYRGYVQRNYNSPYYNATIGYAVKDYNYDANLRCNPPPFYPSIKCEGTDQVEIQITSSTTTKE